MSDSELTSARLRIDQLDEDIQRLISERARIAQEVARIKQKMGGMLGGMGLPPGMF